MGLNSLGIIDWISTSITGSLSSMHLAWPSMFLLIHGVYFFSHYMFASQTAHVLSLYAACMAMMMGAGAPGLLCALSLAMSTNLFGALTHYASGQAAVFYGTGHIPLATFWKQGFYV